MLKIFIRIFTGIGLLLNLNGLASAQKAAGGKHKIISYNIWNAFEDNPELQHQGIRWIRQQRPDVVTLQELVGFTQEKLQQWAQKWGHHYAVILKEEGYPTGLTSRWPITNIDRRLKGMHHGYLYAETGGLAFAVLHLSPFSYEKRIQETEFIVRHLNNRRKPDQPTFVLGDFNAVSPYDSLQYKKNKLVEPLRASDRQYDHVENLKNGKLDYAVLQYFYDRGWIDIVNYFASQRWMASFPTPALGPIKDNERQRIDYILTNHPLSSQIDTAYIDTMISASDHYPVVTTLSR